jgi:carotenoid cleavage dioxygenase
MVHSTANTHIYFYAGVLLALKEDSPPYALDPTTLRTIGRDPSMLSNCLGLYDFNGKLPSPTFTAHPKVDGRTGTMYAYGYEAKGDASTGYP